MPENENTYQGEVHIIEDEQYHKQKNTRDFKGVLEALIVVLFLLLLAAIVIPTSKRLRAREEGMMTLREAKTLVMAVHNTSYDYDGKNLKMTRDNEDVDLTDKALSDAMKLADAKGSVEYLNYDDTNAVVTRMQYRKGDILVTYSRSKKDNSGKWNVYQLDSIVKD